jgi:hypothetical protein
MKTLGFVVSSGAAMRVELLKGVKHLGEMEESHGFGCGVITLLSAGRLKDEC